MAKCISKAQKQILNRYVGTFLTFDELPADIRTALERLRVYETLWCDVDRYLQDNNL